MKKLVVSIARDTVLFIIGLLGVAHETLVNDADRPTLLLLFSAMIGLPAFISKDSKESKEVDEK